MTNMPSLYDVRKEIEEWERMTRFTDAVTEISKQAGEGMGEHIAMYAAAFMKETGLKAADVELVVRYELDGPVFKFVEKRKGPKE